MRQLEPFYGEQAFANGQLLGQRETGNSNRRGLLVIQSTVDGDLLWQLTRRWGMMVLLGSTQEWGPICIEPAVALALTF
jgi:hypothetical protein